MDLQVSAGKFELVKQNAFRGAEKLTISAEMRV
jgi:hypothetical protein